MGLRPNEEETVVNKYILAWYFVNTVFSTVGFGDISAQTQPERLCLVGNAHVAEPAACCGQAAHMRVREPACLSSPLIFRPGVAHLMHVLSPDSRSPCQTADGTHSVTGIMYVGVMVFGTLLSEVQNTIEDLYHLRFVLPLLVLSSLTCIATKTLDMMGSLLSP